MSQAENGESDQKDEYYQVEKIINHRNSKGKRLYQVKWVGYSMRETTWEPLENLKNVI